MKIQLSAHFFLSGKNTMQFIMRIFILLFCVFGFAMCPNYGVSQNTVVISKDQRIGVDQVFNLIKKQTDFKFIYRSNLFENMPRVSLKKGTIEVDELLTKSLSPNFTHEYSRNKVILIKKIRKRPVQNVKKQQQTFIIEGQVKDINGIQIVGASVVISEDPTNSLNTFVKGTETDFNGFFKIEATQGFYLSVFYIGFEDYKEKLETKKDFYNIELKESINKLDEVVLTGYTKTLVKESTVASSKIIKKEIFRQKAINLTDKLEGLSSGLNLTSVTEDGGQRRFELILRGTSTFNQNFVFIDDDGTLAQNSLNRQPLIVLDGFPYEGPLNDIDPQIIESIDVLKDAAATALWGLRASNGVLVITTKRGRKKTKTSVTVTSNLTIGTRQDLSQLGIASAADHINVYNHFRGISPEGGTAAELVFTDGGGQLGSSRYLLIDSYDQIWADFENPVNPISAAERDRRLELLGQNDAVKDFEKYLLIPGFIRENSISVQGGGENISIAFTGTQVAEDRPDLGDTFKRLSLSLTTDIKINDKLSTNFDIGITSSTTRDNAIGSAALTTSIRPYESLVDDNGNPRAVRNIYSGFQQEFLDLGFEDPSFNPIVDQRFRDNENKRFNLRMALGLNYKVAKGLVADIKFQQNKITSNINNNLAPELFSRRTVNNQAISQPITADNNFVIRSLPFGGVLQREISSQINDILRSTLNYNVNIKESHKISALTGIEFTSNTTELARRNLFGYDDVTGISRDDFDPRQTSIENGLDPLEIPSFLFGVIDVRDNSEVRPEVENRTVSTFGNLAYTYKDRYNINFSGKIDQATAFGINKRLSKQLLWASSFSWNIDEESFFKVPWVDALKFRASYGINGNLRRGLTTETVITEDIDPITGQNIASIVDAGNPNLTFEDTETINLGIDFSLFNNRIQATLDVYDRQSKNLLIPDLINPTFGQTANINRNAGAISNRGIEVNLNFDILRNSYFTWNGNFNMSYNKNEVVAVNMDTDTSDASFFASLANDGITEILGADISSQYRYRWAGLDNTGSPQIFNENNDVIGVGDPLPTVGALEITKPFVAPGFGGLRNTFGYKNISLSFLASFKFGHVFQEALRPKSPEDIGSFISEDIVNVWQQPGDELFTNIPALITSFDDVPIERQEFFTLSNYLLQDASFIRLRDITLAYQMDREVLSKIGLNQLNFSFQARNLGLIWKANTLDLDPESVPFSISGISNVGGFASAFRPGIRPPVTFVFGITANF